VLTRTRNSPSPARASALLLGVALLPVGIARAQILPPSRPQTVTVTTAEGTAEAPKKLLPVDLSLAVETSVGLGTFVRHEGQRQPQVATVAEAVASYPLTDEIKLSLDQVTTWYHLMDYGSPYYDGQVLLSDTWLQVAHSKVWVDEDLGLTLAGMFRVYAPTSLASRFQNRLFTLRPGLSMTFAKGPFSVVLFGAVAKYFGRSTTPSVSCDDFDDPETCREGRGPDVGGTFTSEKKGGETFIPSAGVNSFYVLYDLAAQWQIVDGLMLGIEFAMYHLYGIASRPIDELSSPNARPGRNQTDRFISELALEYTLNANLAVGVALSTDTVQPLGADGKDFVVLDFERAPDNISSVSLTLTGKL
jgi:hypothetical protein